MTNHATDTTSAKLANQLLHDGISRIGAIVHAATKGLSEHELAQQPDGQGNSIAWLIWHLSRVQDDHIAGLADSKQIWTGHGWHKKFDLPFEDSATGYGHSVEDVAMVQASADLLTGYYNAVQTRSLAYIDSLTAEQYQEVIDTQWDPPVTRAVRLMSILGDDLQHAGQAMYVRGLL